MHRATGIDAVSVYTLDIFHDRGQIRIDALNSLFEYVIESLASHYNITLIVEKKFLANFTKSFRYLIWVNYWTMNGSPLHQYNSSPNWQITFFKCGIMYKVMWAMQKYVFYWRVECSTFQTKTCWFILLKMYRFGLFVWSTSLILTWLAKIIPQWDDDQIIKLVWFCIVLMLLTLYYIL